MPFHKEVKKIRAAPVTQICVTAERGLARDAIRSVCWSVTAYLTVRGSARTPRNGRRVSHERSGVEPDGTSNLVCCITLHAWHHMRVPVECEFRRGVSESFAHHADRNPGLDCNRGMRVS